MTKGVFPRRSAEERFWSHVEKSPDPKGCWLWTGVAPRYGQIRVNGARQGAHRFSYELHFGPIPAGMMVCHHCDVPKCVRPDHLFVGTNSDNMQDSFAKGRRHMPSGDDHWTRRRHGMVPA